MIELQNSCPAGFYGTDCNRTCYCQEYQYCHQMNGCICKYNNISEDKCNTLHDGTSLLLENSSNVTPIIDKFYVFSILIVILILTILLIIFYYLRKRRENTTKGEFLKGEQLNNDFTKARLF